MNTRSLFKLFGMTGGGEDELIGICESTEPRPNCLTFIRRWSPEAARIVASNPRTTFIVPLEGDDPAANCVAVANPRLAFAVASREVVGQREWTGIASTAVVHETASIDATASVGHFTVIDEQVTIGARSIIGSHVRLHPGVTIGADCIVSNHTSIGSSGFGFEVAEDGRPIRIAHVGGVTVGDRVEIGTHVAIAQGTIRPTLIENDVKIDDAVFIAHNVRIGPATYVIAGACICGSVDIGSGVWVSPESTVINKAVVGDGALIGLGAVVVKDVPPDIIVAGVPAKERGSRNG